jgi:hypothetical protein
MTTGTTTGCTVTGMTTYQVPSENLYYTKFGCTKNTIVPVTSSGFTYGFQILLTQNITDIGFLDAYLVDAPYDYINIAATPDGLNKFKKFLSGGTTLAASGLIISHSNGDITGTTITNIPYNVTGVSSSRLSELRKYSTSSVFTNQYFGSGSPTVDGVDFPNSNPLVRIVYYLGGIRYVDLLTGFTSGTTYSFAGVGYNSPNFINKPLYKDPNKENIISNPKINDDVFIVRQELSAFDKNYRLEYIKNMIDLETYAGGNFFNIVKNS